MEQAAQTDILILFLIFLSALIGFSRGFSFEAASLTVYIFSGFFGYCLIPAFLPAFSSFIPHDKTAWGLSLALGSFLSWIFLRMFVFSLAQNVKNSRFRRLDRSLGAVFGGGICLHTRHLVSLCCSDIPHCKTPFQKMQVPVYDFANAVCIFYKIQQKYSQKNSSVKQLTIRSGLV